jgi:glycosidase
MYKKIFLITIIFVSVAISVHAAEPQWEDQVIYMLMLDRFANGDPSNDNFNEGEYGIDNAHYNGGDLQGLIDKLDYLKDLGITAIWITPLVANQWWNPWVNYGGYHGYWARDFKKVDEHFGDMELYKKLVEEAHKRGIYVIQDIVTNHVGDYFRFVDGEFQLNEESAPSNSPTQYPFSLNNYNEDKDQNIYHWTPDITNFESDEQRLNYQMSGLDDLNTENPEVVEALKDSYTQWIKEVGIDGFRIDTVIYVPHEFWKEFLNGEDGIYDAAREAGKNNETFITFGEAWVSTEAFDNTAEKKIKEYFDDGMNAMLDFPLNIALRQVFKEGKATSNLAYRLEQRQQIYENPERMVTFVDNHDMERFLQGAGLINLKQALSFIFTIPGIPTVYYGTEQGFSETRAAMFKEGYASGGEDHYDRNFELYNFIQELVVLRKNNPVFRYGSVEVLKENPNGPGVFAYKIDNGEKTAFVLFNTSQERRILANLETGLEPGSVVKPLFTEATLAKSYSTGADGEIDLVLNPRCVYVGVATAEKDEIDSNTVEIYPDLEDGMKINSNYVITGTSKNAERIRIIFDRRIDQAVEIPVEADKWSFEWDISKFDPGVHTVLFKVYGEKRTNSKYSEDYSIVLDIPEEIIAQVEDPEGDDHGPTGDYKYPSDVTFNEQMDLLSVTVKKIGSSINISMETANLTTSWSPQNGFDHVTFQIFIDDPNKTGATELPKLNATMPKNYDWDYFIFANGWSIVAYSPDGSGPDNFGTPISPTPLVKTDKMKNEVTLIISGELLDRPESLEGYKFYITTWDFDGIEAKYRDLFPEPKAYHFGGGTKEDPYIMDDILIEIE